MTMGLHEETKRLQIFASRVKGDVVQLTAEEIEKMDPPIEWDYEPPNDVAPWWSYFR